MNPDELATFLEELEAVIAQPQRYRAQLKRALANTAAQEPNPQSTIRNPQSYPVPEEHWFGAI